MVVGLDRFHYDAKSSVGVYTHQVLVSSRLVAQISNEPHKIPLETKSGVTAKF